MRVTGNYLGGSELPAVVDYAIRKKVEIPYEEAIERTKAAFKEEGFGVLTEIDVRNTLKEKIGADFRKYVILGMCNPQLAHRALLAEADIGVMLPCNVVIYEGDGGTVVAAQNPEASLDIVGNPQLSEVAEEATDRIIRALRSI